MKLKTMLAVAVAGAFALPFAAQASADGERIILAQAGHSDMGTSAGATGSARMNESGFSMLDKNNDGQISRAEWDAHHGPSSGSASGGATTSPSGSGMTSGGSGTTGTTAGPDSASNRTAPSSDTATSPSTSGHGKAN